LDYRIKDLLRAGTEVHVSTKCRWQPAIPTRVLPVDTCPAPDVPLGCSPQQDQIIDGAAPDSVSGTATSGLYRSTTASSIMPRSARMAAPTDLPSVPIASARASSCVNRIIAICLSCRDKLRQLLEMR
jgi:hypothetical protein